MTDERLRELERKWRERQSVEHESSWLRARVAAGELDPSKLALARHLGYPAAAEGSTSTPTEEVSEEALCLLDQPAALRALVALGRRAEVAAGDGFGAAALSAAEDWIVCPCNYHADAARVAAEFPVSFLGGEGPLLSTPTARLAAGLLSGGDYFSTNGLEEARSRGNFTPIIRFALDCLEEQGRQLNLPVAPLSWLRDELAPWALGYSDPVSARVLARGGGAPPPDWAFPDPANSVAGTRNSIAEHGADVLQAVHHEGQWFFLDTCRPDPLSELFEIGIDLGRALALDPSLAEVGDLPDGWRAFRTEKNAPWQRAALVPEPPLTS